MHVEDFDHQCVVWFCAVDVHWFGKWIDVILVEFCDDVHVGVGVDLVVAHIACFVHDCVVCADC